MPLEHNGKTLFLLKQKSKPIQQLKKRKVTPLLGTFGEFKKAKDEEEILKSQQAYMGDPNPDLDQGASDGEDKIDAF